MFNQSVWDGYAVDDNTAKHGRAHGAPAATRLALEMALHESSEQRALETELASLEQAWRDAEEIAAIADGVLTPMPRR